MSGSRPFRRWLSSSLLSLAKDRNKDVPAKAITSYALIIAHLGHKCQILLQQKVFEGAYALHIRAVAGNVRKIKRLDMFPD